MESVARRSIREFGLFAAVSFLTRLSVLWVPVVDIDESSHLAAAWVMQAGGRLYLDAADHKPPLVFLYYAFTQVLGHGMLAVRLFTHLIWVPLAALAVSHFWVDQRRGRVAALTFLVGSVGFVGHDMLAVNTELLGLLPLALALLCVRTADALSRPVQLLAAGVLVGVASLFRYQLGIVLPAVALGTLVAPVPWGRRLGGWAALAVGFLAPVLLAWATFALRGASEQYLYWNYTHNFAYTSAGPSIGEAAGRLVRYCLPLLAISSPLWFALWRSRRDMERPVYVMLVALCLGVVAAGALGGRFYPHYFIPLFVPLAIGAAPMLTPDVVPPVSAPGRRWLIYGALVLGIATLSTVLLYSGRVGHQVERRPVFADVAARLRSDPCYPGARLFVWGYAPTFYTAADLLPASRFLYVDNTLVGHVSGHHTLRPDLIRSDHWDLLMQDLERTRPVFVIDAADARLSRWKVPMRDHPKMRLFVDASYDAIAVIDRAVVYRRRGCVPPGDPAAVSTARPRP